MRVVSRRRRALPALLAVLLALVCGVVCVPAPVLAEEGDQAAYSADEPPALSARYALLIDRETGTVLLDQGSDERWYPASVTKVMTALLTIENVDLDETVTVTEEDLAEVTWDSSIAGLVPGDTLTVRDLLAGLMIPSGNDASYVLARYVGGGDWHAFVDMMNERAAELGCTDTHFVNPCGLHDDDHYSTCADLALIFEEALKHPEFVEVSSAATWELPETSVAPARELKNTDVLIDPESPVYMGDTIVSSKTGSTVEGGKSLIVLAERDGRSLIGVVMGAPLEADAAGVAPNFYDMRSLLEWGFGAWQTGEVVSVGDVVGSAEVSLSSDGDAVDALATTSVVATVPVGTTLEDLTFVPSWSGALQAPLEDGAALGEVNVSLGERELGTVSAGAARAMGLSIPAFLVWWLTSDPVHVVLAVVGVVTVLVVVGVVASSSSRARRRRRAASSPHRRAVARSVEPVRLRPPSRSRGGRGGSHLRR